MNRIGTLARHVFAVGIPLSDSSLCLPIYAPILEGHPTQYMPTQRRKMHNLVTSWYGIIYRTV